MDSKERKWKVGDRYQVVDDGRRIAGTIKKIENGKYHVEWADGDTTIEDTISPASPDALRLYPAYK